ALPAHEVAGETRINSGKGSLGPASVGEEVGDDILIRIEEIDVGKHIVVRPIGQHIQGEKGQSGGHGGVRCWGQCVVLNGSHHRACGGCVIVIKAVKNQSAAPSQRYERC